MFSLAHFFKRKYAARFSHEAAIILALALYGCNSKSNTPQATTSITSPEKLIELWGMEHRTCWAATNGGANVDDKGACERAKGFQQQLTDIGWCWGNTPYPTPDTEWHECTKNRQGNSSTAYSGPHTTEIVDPQPTAVQFRANKIVKVFGAETAFPELIVTSKNDTVNLTEIIINRGNCRLLYAFTFPSGNSSFPMTLQYGDQFKMRGECDPTEIEFVTDRGTAIYEW